MAWKRPQVNVTSDINVTPLVDVMLVLLIIFMVITPLMQNHLNVTLAQTVNAKILPDADKEDAVIVAVSHDGHIYLGNDMMSPDELSDKVKDLISDRLDKIVYIRADARAQYKGVVDVVNAIRDAGVENVAMLTERIEKNGSPPAGGE